jgi:hypothetical protein
VSGISEDTIEALIEEKEEELRPIRARMEELSLQFVNDTAKFASKWYEETAKEYVTKYPEITLSMTKEKLANMKSKVTNLARTAGKPVKAALSKHQNWWHLEPGLHDFSQYEQLGNDQVGNRFPEKIDKPIRRALGELGAILEQYGFNVTIDPAMKATYPEFWFSYPNGEGTQAQPYYPHLLVWSEDMQDTLQKYNGQFKKAIRLFNEIQRLKDELKKRQASKLWDST